jgi:hypothetical protein
LASGRQGAVCELHRLSLRKSLLPGAILVIDGHLGLSNDPVRLARFRRGADVAFGSCHGSAFIIAIRGTIGSPPCSPTSIRHSIAVSQCGNSRSALGNLMMYRATPQSVTSGFRPGNMIGSKNRCSHATGLRQPQGELTVRTDVAGNEVLDMLGDGGAFDVAAGLNFEGSIF